MKEVQKRTKVAKLVDVAIVYASIVSRELFINEFLRMFFDTCRTSLSVKVFKILNFKNLTRFFNVFFKDGFHIIQS